jgi:hypothetical protein
MISAIVLLGTLSSINATADRPLSPTEAAYSLEGMLKPVTVRLKIGAVEKRIGGWVLVADAKLEGRDRFEVELSPAAAADFARLGVSDLVSHFEGREVEVRGRVGGIGVWSEPMYFIKVIRVESLDQIRGVR